MSSLIVLFAFKPVSVIQLVTLFSEECLGLGHDVPVFLGNGLMTGLDVIHRDGLGHANANHTEPITGEFMAIQLCQGIPPCGVSG